MSVILSCLDEIQLLTEGYKPDESGYTEVKNIPL